MYKDPDFDLTHITPALPIALEGHTSLYTAELGLLVCGGKDWRRIQQDACYTLKLSERKWRQFRNQTSLFQTAVKRVHACVQRIGDSIQIRGGTNFGNSNTRCHKSMEVLDLKNTTQGFLFEEIVQTTDCDHLLSFDQNEITVPCP